MNPVKYNLVALGSAAVLTVYSAGFMRTKAAADKFAAADAERGHAVAATDHIPSEAPALPVSIQASQPVADGKPRPVVPAATAVAQSSKEHPISAKPSAAAAPSSPTTPPTATTAGSSVDTTAEAKVVPPPVPVVANVPPSSQTAAPPARSADTAQTPAKDRGPYKDGTYSGWGTSRHGDIQATVEIHDGHITAAWISQCLTRYPCSRIASIVPQVVARQSANVDYISGATQSSNAYYYAIAEALAQAK